jgi:hypothetical protein
LSSHSTNSEASPANGSPPTQSSTPMLNAIGDYIHNRG